eukprot:CAMPEP_0206273660 /NCGR_PEP_ID=MMETSP0047_2-20121206/34721_1 /ASSEMBLY_ACC=CAM_ASM_000192 /TAXON_ID=195065 /ORGANISM="Chroomonas mesostigmatica_cf, Strain CCMP1168" /LENGTH=75 /DNA_ID=CAMNT_0053702785 /DNA_START=3 /DNA_END=227 /DNA_ORIENTATION=-
MSSKGKGLGKQYLGDEPKVKIAVPRSYRIDPEVVQVFVRRVAPPEKSIIELDDVRFDSPEIPMTRGFSERDGFIH